MKTITYKISFYILILTAIVANGCRKSEMNSSNTFRLNFPLGIETLEPVMSNSPQTIWVLMNVMEGLVAYNRQNEIIPQIAKSWEISEDGLTYTFYLKGNIRFHDDACFPDGKGRFVTSSDFKYCLERVNDPSSKTRGLWVFRDKIKGANNFYEYKAGKSSKVAEGISGILTPNDTTLIIKLAEPFAPFLSLLTMTYAFVYPKEAVDFYGNNFSVNPVGTGPFMFKEWQQDKQLLLSKNPAYHESDSAGKRLPYLDEVEITFTKSQETEFLDFLNGRYDYHEPSSEIIDAITDEKGKMIDAESKDYSLVKQPWLNTVYLIMVQNENLPAGKSSPFLNNKKLRQALNYAIDKERIVRYVLKNRGHAAYNGPLPVGMPGYDTAVKGYRYNEQKAKELLSEAGFPDGKGLSLTLYISNDELQKNIAISIQEQMKDIGIDFKLEQMLQATLNTQQQQGELAFTRGNWGADYFDPENFLSLFYSKNIVPFGPNKTGYSNPEIDKLYEKSIKLTDFNERREIYNEMERIVIDDAAWVFLYYNQKHYLLRNNIKGFYLDGLNNLVLKYTAKK